jgi:ribonuclease HII
MLEIPPDPTLDLEKSLWQAGVVHIAGLDEAGRGAWAGPVAAAAVILPPDCAQTLSGVRDSKQMTARQRAQSAILIRQQAIAWGVGMASVFEIDELGIVPATRLAMQRALDALHLTPQHLLIDALRLPTLSIPQTALIKGDRRSLSIAAASVLAKTSRDALLCELEHNFPGYGFAQHKGYGTAAHRTALAHLGACPQHRQSFQPVSTSFRTIRP